MSLDIAIIGLSISSSWGNGHATTYRSLVKGLSTRGHRIAFYERDRPWYRDHRDQPANEHASIVLYESPEELLARHGASIRNADLVILGSFVPDGVAIGEWLTRSARGVTAFYDIDTPVTLAGLEARALDYLSPPLLPRFDLYLSFTGGPTLQRLEREFGAQRARPLYCAVDPDLHRPVGGSPNWDLGYLGTYSLDRQPSLEKLLIDPARSESAMRFVIGGAQYPNVESWPPNVEWIPHVAPAEHAAFYGAQRFTLNVTRAQMIAAGFSPSVRLFEAAACGAPIVSDVWEGLSSLLVPGQEILTVADAFDVTAILTELSEEKRRSIGEAARRRVLASHTGAARARELEDYFDEAVEGRRRQAAGNHARRRTWKASTLPMLRNV